MVVSSSSKRRERRSWSAVTGADSVTNNSPAPTVRPWSTRIARFMRTSAAGRTRRSGMRTKRADVPASLAACQVNRRIFYEGAAAVLAAERDAALVYASQRGNVVGGGPD